MIKLPFCSIGGSDKLNIARGFSMFRFIMTVVLFGLPLTSLASEPPSTAQAGGEFVGADICSECHENKFEQILPSKHAQMNDLRTPFAKQGCETCHGAGEVHASAEGEDLTGLIVYGKDSGVPPDEQNARCLGCHQDTGRMHWQGSPHESADLVCTSCHLIHQPDGVLRKEKESDVCTTCHWKVRADMHKASVHPIRQGLLTCTDCHNPHGSDGPKSLKTLTLNQTCYKCHAEKRGPFLWEHEPVTEDCMACHSPHGSNNPALLVRRPPQLCQQCHQVVGGGGMGGGLGGHVNRELDWGGGPGTWTGGGPNRTQLILGVGCLNCHSQVHGSNHPSGPVLQR
jgi:DmsE family decaheme c-type cytochrome